MNIQTILESDDLVVAADEITGAVRSFRLFGEELLDTESNSSDVSVNGSPLTTTVAPPTWTHINSYPQNAIGSELNEMHGCRFFTHYTGFGLDVTRAMRQAGPGLAHLTYTVQRTKIRTLYPEPGAGWGALEAPLHLETLGFPGWQWKLWGEATQMMVLSTGSAGPPQHVGYDHGSVANVKQAANTWFRRHYSGDMGLPGALFHNPQTGHWLAITCRRPHIAYNINHEAAGQAISFDFLPLGELALNQTVQLPSVAFHYGRDEESRQRFLATFLSAFYEEPAEWFFRTTWMDVSLNPELFDSWQEADKAMEALTENGAVSGLMFVGHERNLAYGGTSPNSYGPAMTLGTRNDFEAMARRLKQKGVRLLMWMSSCGVNPQSDTDSDWYIRGADGDWLPAWGLPHQPHIVYVNQLHPGYLAHVEKWIRYYLLDLDFDGFLFDCAAFPYPPDYKPREWMAYPSDTMLGNIRFFDFVRELVRKIKPDAAIVTEGACLDAFSNALFMGSNEPSEADGMGQREFLMSLRKHGGARFLLKAPQEGDLAAGLVTVNPSTNFWHGPNDQRAGLEWYQHVGAEPFNVQLTEIMRRHGCREAIPLVGGSGISYLPDAKVLIVPQPRAYTMPVAALVPAGPGERSSAGLRLKTGGTPLAGHRLQSRLSGRELVPDEDGVFVFYERDIYDVMP